ncbi:MAG: hypothetical protein HOC71_18015, partial [Candidatus Latescibacteria bacterium]|nr:hypothetical protein [Candidatus Latescibacterota bacterium]
LEMNQHLSRFGRLSVQVPPKVPVILDVKQIRREPDPGDLPDLATSSYYIKKKGDSLVVTIHNIGCAPSGPFTITVFDPLNNELKSVKLDSIESPVDFVPRHVDVTIPGLESHEQYHIRIDSENAIREIFEENNDVDFAAGNSLK